MFELLFYNQSNLDVLLGQQFESIVRTTNRDLDAHRGGQQLNFSLSEVLRGNLLFAHQQHNQYNNPHC
jgi:hypothetical protein